ncbi:hypothetical protein ABT173_32660 [Streptomyces sp. NPDC001795]|uniref:hypothetical protein n=1 Tax=unclassified Streptomyces TaxID=2593676 RepID=UPI0033165997
MHTTSQASPVVPAPSARGAAVDERWWVVLVLCTPLAPALGCLDYAYSAFTGAPLIWAVGYLLPAGLLTRAWLLPRTRAHRPERRGLAVAACATAFLYTKVLTPVVYAVAFVLWVAYGSD